MSWSQFNITQSDFLIIAAAIQDIWTSSSWLFREHRQILLHQQQKDFPTSAAELQVNSILLNTKVLSSPHTTHPNHLTKYTLHCSKISGEMEARNRVSTKQTGDLKLHRDAKIKFTEFLALAVF